MPPVLSQQPRSYLLIAQHDLRPIVHAHVVVGRSDGTTAGGHLLQLLELDLSCFGAYEIACDATPLAIPAPQESSHEQPA
jgi:hypothetical protein